MEYGNFLTETLDYKKYLIAAFAVVINSFILFYNDHMSTWLFSGINGHLYRRSSTLAWKIPWMEEPGRLRSMGSLRVGRD